MKPVVFNDIQVGKNFTTPANITYQKITVSECKPIIDPKGKTIANGLVSTAFYNTKILLTPIN